MDLEKALPLSHPKGLLLQKKFYKKSFICYTEKSQAMHDCVHLTSCISVVPALGGILAEAQETFIDFFFFTSEFDRLATQILTLCVNLSGCARDKEQKNEIATKGRRSGV